MMGVGQNEGTLVAIETLPDPFGEVTQHMVTTPPFLDTLHPLGIQGKA